MRLTKKILDQATYEGHSYTGKDGKKKWSRYVLWDDQIPGLGLRITPPGRKSFVMWYRKRGRVRLMSLGRYGALTLQQARERAQRVSVEVLDGTDPLQAREDSRATFRLKELADRYLEQHAIPKKKPSSAAEDRRLLEKHILPALGTLPVAEVAEDDISRLHHSLRKTPILANRLLALLSMMFTLADRWGWRPDGSNPARRIERFRERRRERFLSLEEVARLGEVLNDVEEERIITPAALKVIRLLLLTGCRRSEILTLKWAEVDFERKLLVLSDSKTGAKTVPLGSVALKILRETSKVIGCPYVFPGRSARSHFVGINNIWNQIRDRAGLPDVRLHDLRHSFASVGAGSGHGLPILGKLLGHRDSSTTARYAHLADDPLREAAEAISGTIGAALEGGTAVNGQA